MYGEAHYQCHSAEPNKGLSATCYSPGSMWPELVRNTHQSHEFRVSSPDDWRVRGIYREFVRYPRVGHHE